MDAPDYSQYTLEELEQAYRSLDHSAYPQRAALLRQMIEERQAPAGPISDTAAPTQTPVSSTPVYSAMPSPSEAAVTVDPYSDGPVSPFSALARRRERLAAYVIDALIATLTMVPLLIYFGLDKLSSGEPAILLMMLVYGVLSFLCVHGYLIYERGQTVGKHFLHIRVEDRNGNKASFSRYFFRRYLIMAVFYSLPFIGPLISLLDPLFIFRSNRRCLHDEIAKTQVAYLPD
ncbi:RDD family protein [Salinimonas lutimaris]|uniref:RDD family protein n=1 Tax=Salinimonas lutimaris TaxID=914153 RepID=UPI0010C05513|nr:RDD family protein [Salinimonas lutimaris]